MTIEHKSDIIRKIQKCLALGKDKAAFSAESATALEMATRLMEAHGLSMKEVDFKPDGQVDESQFTELRTEGRGMWPWEKNLVLVICKIMAVEAFFTSYGNGYKSIVWVGTKQDVELAGVMYDQLRSELKRLSRVEPTPLEKRSFLTGAVHVLIIRASDLEQMRKASQEESRALMVVKKNAVEKWMHKRHPDMRDSQDRGSNIDRHAFERGRSAGAKMKLGSDRPQLGWK